MKLDHKNFVLLPLVGLEPDLSPEKTQGVSFERAFGESGRTFELVNAVKEGFDIVKRAFSVGKIKNWLQADPLEQRYIEEQLGVIHKNKVTGMQMGNQIDNTQNNQPVQPNVIQRTPSAPTPKNFKF